MRLTTDKPDGNFETALNLFYCKDGTTWVRGGGPAPEYPDVELNDWIRVLIAQHGDDKELADKDKWDDSSLNDVLSDMVFDGTETIDGVLALLYQEAWAFSELNARLKEYEDAEDAGLLHILPMPIGETCYMRHRIFGVNSVSEEKFSIGYQPVSQNKTPPDPPTSGSNAVPPKKYCDLFGKSVFATREEAENGFVEAKT